MNDYLIANIAVKMFPLFKFTKGSSASVAGAVLLVLLMDMEPMTLSI